jgi:hypothetical protein
MESAQTLHEMHVANRQKMKRKLFIGDKGQASLDYRPKGASSLMCKGVEVKAPFARKLLESEWLHVWEHATVTE